MQTHYEILGISKTANDAEIKKAFRNQIKAYHPDINTIDKETSIQRITEITKAYEVLINHESRKEYDMPKKIKISEDKVINVFENVLDKMFFGK